MLIVSAVVSIKTCLVVIPSYRNDVGPWLDYGALFCSNVFTRFFSIWLIYFFIIDNTTFEGEFANNFSSPCLLPSSPLASGYFYYIPAACEQKVADFQNFTYFFKIWKYYLLICQSYRSYFYLLTVSLCKLITE